LSWTASTDNVGVTGYEVYQDGVLLGLESGTTFAVTNLALGSQEYKFYVKAKDAAGNPSESSTAVSTFCSLKGARTDLEWIDRVELNTLNNLSGSGSGYSNYTHQSTVLIKGKDYTLRVTPKWRSRVYEEGYVAWIDYNRNGSFEDKEKVWEQSKTNKASVTGTIKVPAEALEGVARMRVAMSDEGIPGKCGNFRYGEVEDYTVVIKKDTEAPSSPVLTSSSTTNTVNLNWTASYDDVGVVGYMIYQNGTYIRTVSGTSASIQELGDNTYEYYVLAIDAAGNRSSSSNKIVVKIDTTKAYCISKGQSTRDEYLSEVRFGDMWNKSDAQGSTGYSDFSNLRATVTKGNTYTLHIFTTWTSTEYREGYSVWIDYDQNGIFDDQERVWSRLATMEPSALVWASITIPTTAKEGVTRMRVAMMYDGMPGACESFRYGEVEDYGVVITKSAGYNKFSTAKTVALRTESNEIIDINRVQGLYLYPNPATQAIHLSEVESIEHLVMYDTSGKEVYTASPVVSPIAVSGLASGLYIVRIRKTDGTEHELKFLKQ